MSGLHLAASLGLAVILDALLELGMDVNANNSHGMTPLHLAINEEQLKAVTKLLDSKADIEAADELRERPTHHAAAYGDYQTLHLLLERGADANAKDIDGWTALHQVTYQDHDESLVRDLLEYEAEVQHETSDGRLLTAMDSAAANGNRKSVELLFEKGADTNHRNGNGETPIGNAAKEGHVEVLRFLIRQGVDVNDKSTDWDEPAIVWAAEHKQEEAVKILLEHSADVAAVNVLGKTALHYAVENFLPETIEFLLKHNASIDIRDDQNRTPMECSEQKEVMEVILKNIVSCNKRGPVQKAHRAALQGDIETLSAVLTELPEIAYERLLKGDNVLHIAAWQGHTAMVSMLLSRQLPVNMLGRSDETALHKAARGGHDETVRVLCQAGADVNARAVNDMIPLRHAAANGHLKTVQTLLERADIEVNIKTEFPAIHGAIERGHHDVTRLLVRHGADLACVDDRWGLPPIGYALYLDSTDILASLLDGGAGPNTRSTAGQTALHLACDLGNIDAVALLLASPKTDLRAKDDAGQTAREMEGPEHELITPLIVAAEVQRKAAGTLDRPEDTPASLEELSIAD